MAKVNKKDFDRNIDDQIRAYNTLVELQRKEFEGLSQILSVESRRNKMLLELQQAENTRNVRFQEYEKLMKDAAAGQVQVNKVTLTAIEKQLKKEQENIVKLQRKERVMRSIASIKFPDFSKLADWNFLSDKPIRETVLELGLGAERSQLIRNAFYEATPKVTQLGAGMKDLYEVQKSYTMESGRAVALTGKELINITEIAKGTTLGAAAAGQLVAQFAQLGINTERSKEIVQGIVDSSERMGVNVNKVLKTVSTNFKTLNTFAFRDGIKGMVRMAQYAEKFKVDMSATIDSAERARTLDGAIEMASQLQTLGGEFAKADPFELFHLSRNDPAKYTQRLNEMTKGMGQLVKTADGFQLQIAPVDLDRLREVAKATGQDFGNLVEQVNRMTEIQAMNREMMGTSFTKEDRELIQSMAKLDTKTGIYKVLGTNIKDLSAQQIKSLQVQQQTLKERAEASQTFDERFNNTINSMKFTLLPLLDGINAVFDTLHPIMKKFADFVSDQPQWAKTGLAWAGGLLGAGIVLGKVANTFKSIPWLGKLMSSGAKGIGGAIASGAGGAGGKAAQAVGGTKGSFGAGAGIGAAGLGIGAGVAVAAVGISKLADSMSKLNDEQVDALKTIATVLAVSFPLAAIGVGILAAVAAPAAGPLLALGAAIFGIGAGIGVASAGIGYMANGFSTLLSVAEPQKVFALAAGVTALGGAMMTMSGGAILSLFTGGGAFAMLGLLSTRADAFERIGKSMRDISVVLNSDGKGLEKLKQTLDSISKVNSNTGMFGELKSLFKDGLKVKFDDKNVQMNVNVSLEVDSEVIARKTAKRIVVLQNDYRNGKAG